jgi:pSer/pThr/pTyr-binding forkhead associated (FHA) protein
MIKISVYNADSLLQEFESEDDKEISIGRAQGCSIRLDEASISRLHAVIFPLGGGWVLQRKANFGAVLLNGQEVENAPLEGGEELKVGNFSLRIEITEAQPTSLTGSKPVVTSSRSLVASGGGGTNAGEDDGRTKFVTAGVSALFRMEPGSANLDEFLMEKDMALFGRGSNCDVVLTEKKASRKHFEVRRQGLSFFLKDLNSANGTLVNGVAVTEAELVAGDHIQVGESKIQFSIENKEFFAKQDQFLPVPAHLQQASSGPDMGALGMPGDAASVQEYGPDGQPIAPVSDQELGPDGTPLPPKPNSSTDFIGHAKYKWAKIPKAQRMRYLAIVVVGSLVMAMLGGPDEEKPKGPKKVPVAGSPRRFEDLTPKNQAFVRENYKALLGAQEKKDFQVMFERARNILSLVDEYNDTKSYESIAKRGLDAIEEEKKKKALEEKQAAIRREVAALEEKGQAIFERALVDAKARPDLVAMTKEIYVKDPNNRKAQEWLAKVKEKEEEEKRETELARQKEELRQKAEDAYEAVMKIYKDKKYIEAIKASEGLADVGWTEQAYLDKVEKLRSDIRNELKSVLDPLLREAQNQRQEGGDLVKAKEMYLEVLKVDGANQEARMGLDSIRETLHLRAKRFYAEAILAESVSDLAEAKDRYEKCLHTAPEEDIYRKRCRGKLLRFEAFTPEAAGGK